MDCNGHQNNNNNNNNNTNLFVSMPPPLMQDSELVALSSPFGVIDSAKVMLDIHTGRSRGFGFVKFTNAVGATQAISSLNGCAVGESIIAVRAASTKTVFKAPIATSKMFVRNVPPTVSLEQLQDYFGAFGSVVEMKMRLDTSPGSDGIDRKLVFVSYATTGSAVRAVSATHGRCVFADCGAVPLLAKIAESLERRDERLQHAAETHCVPHSAAECIRRASSQSNTSSTSVVSAAATASPSKVVANHSFGSSCSSFGGKSNNTLSDLAPTPHAAASELRYPLCCFGGDDDDDGSFPTFRAIMSTASSRRASGDNNNNNSNNNNNAHLAGNVGAELLPPCVVTTTNLLPCTPPPQHHHHRHRHLNLASISTAAPTAINEFAPPPNYRNQRGAEIVIGARHHHQQHGQEDETMLQMASHVAPPLPHVRPAPSSCNLETTTPVALGQQRAGVGADAADAMMGGGHYTSFPPPPPMHHHGHLYAAAPSMMLRPQSAVIPPHASFHAFHHESRALSSAPFPVTVQHHHQQQQQPSTTTHHQLSTTPQMQYPQQWAVRPQQLQQSQLQQSQRLTLKGVDYSEVPRVALPQQHQQPPYITALMIPNGPLVTALPPNAMVFLLPSASFSK